VQQGLAAAAAAAGTWLGVKRLRVLLIAAFWGLPWRVTVCRAQHIYLHLVTGVWA
jgi:hypothetical protein